MRRATNAVPPQSTTQRILFKFVCVFVCMGAGTFVALAFRRPGGQFGTGPRNDYFFYNVELMRGSVEFLQMQQQRPRVSGPPSWRPAQAHQVGVCFSAEMLMISCPMAYVCAL